MDPGLVLGSPTAAIAAIKQTPELTLLRIVRAEVELFGGGSQPYRRSTLVDRQVVILYRKTQDSQAGGVDIARARLLSPLGDPAPVWLLFL